MRLVKAVDPSCRGLGSKQPVLYTLSKRKLQALTQTHNGCNKMNYSPEYPCVIVTQGHEEHLIPYSVVQPVHIQTKRPVIFSPSILSRGLIERLMQPAESGLMFDTCSPGMWTSIMIFFFAKGRPKYSRAIVFPASCHLPHINLLHVVCRAYSGFRETRQNSVPTGFLQPRPHSRHTPAVVTGGY